MYITVYVTKGKFRKKKFCGGGRVTAEKAYEGLIFLSSHKLIKSDEKS